MQRAQVQDRREFDVPASGARSSGIEQADGTSEIGDLWRILWCRRVLVVCTVLTCFLLALVYVLVAPLKFTATAQILIDPRDRQIVSKEVNPDTLAADGGVLQVESQSRVIESDAVLLKVVRAKNLADDPDYGSPKTGLVAGLESLFVDGGSGTSLGEKEDRALRALRKQLVIKRADKVFVVDIVVTAASGKTAAGIADAVAEAYMADQIEARARSSDQASEALASRLDELGTGVQAAADKVEAYKVSHDLLGTDRQSISDQQLSDNGVQLDAARAKVTELQARADQIDALRRTGVDGGAMQEAVQSSVVVQLRASQAELLRKRADMRTRFGDRYPDLIAINAEIVQGHRQIDVELDRVARSAHSDLDRAKKNERALEGEQDALKRQTASGGQAGIGLRQLVGDLDARRTLYQSFLSRAGETKAQSKIDNTNARIISRAIAPIQPSWPLRAILLLGGLASGLGLGAALAFVVEYLAPTILSAAHLRAAAGTPVIGTVWRRPSRRLPPGGPGSATGAGEAATALRLGLSRLCGPLSGLRDRGRPHTLLVASARDILRENLDVPEALARAGAESGASTLLVEGERSGAEDAADARGFLDVLAGECSLKSVLVLDAGTGHHRLAFGTSRAGSGYPGVGHGFGPFLDQAGRMFDLVVFDGGAIVDDLVAAPIAACVDDVLLVAQGGRTRRREVVEAAEAIAASAGRPVSGALLVGRWAPA